MAWTGADIISLFRVLTGRPDSNQVTDAVILNYINDYYQMAFPFEVDDPLLKGFYTLTVTHETASFAFPSSTVHTLKMPMWIDDGDSDEVVPLNFYQNEQDFYAKWPHDSSRAEGVPEDVLLFGDYLYFRPIADDAATYTFTASKIIVPTALASGTSPLRNAWGRPIAYGAAMQYLIDQREADAVEALVPGYTSSLAIVNRPALVQRTEGARITPSF